ncbi:YfjI family protein [Providencia stuartii]|uniref:YfjI family protein n=1 Tax=Providencia stuartii TaxID=588 RepID=UPI001120938B|nr:YfjI family protein [Providencia stuartii]
MREIKQSFASWGSEDHNQQQQPSDYPIDQLPDLLKETIAELHSNYGTPVELISHMLLTAASLASQSLINIVHPQTQLTEPCALYLLAIAPSGEGKTHIYKQIMQPFYNYTQTMKQEYQEKLTNYTNEANLWKTKKQALDRQYKQAIGRNIDPEFEENKISTHLNCKPVKPIKSDILYEDTTITALIEGLNEYPNVGYVSDEAMLFFKSSLKNHPNFLNKAWDGSPYSFKRSKEELEFTPTLTFSLMSQPDVFHDYLTNNTTKAKGSGFLSRFLLTLTQPRATSTSSAIVPPTFDALHKFQQKISVLLYRQKECLEHGLQTKVSFNLNEEATRVWQQYRAKLQEHIQPDGDWFHIRDCALKASSNTLRLAAILQYVHNDGVTTTLTSQVLNCAIKIINWHLQQASQILYSQSAKYRFEQDARELARWILIKAKQNNWQPFLKSELETYGPHRLRRLDKLAPLLNQLIAQRVIVIASSNSGRPLYIIPRQCVSETFFIPANFGQPIIHNDDRNTVGPFKSVNLKNLI